MNAQERIHPLFADMTKQACQELLEAYGVATQAEQAKGADPGILYCSVLGFNSEHLLGALLLGCDEHLSDEFPDTVPREWVAEMSNQLLGRVKNKLLAYGPEIAMCTPVVLRGQHIAPVPRHETPPIEMVTSRGAHLWVWIDLDAMPGLVLKDQPDSTVAIPEGEAMLF